MIPFGRVIFFFVCIAHWLCLCGCKDGNSHADDRLAEAFAILKAEESFTRFFGTEKTGIRNPKDPDYISARNAYFLECYTVGRKRQAPGETLQRMEDWLEAQDMVIPERVQAVEDAFWLAGMELLSDQPALPYDEKGLKIKRGLTYATQPNKRLLLDLFLPDVGAERADLNPCIICIHGGGFRVHRREWFAGHAAGFARAGFAAVTIDYRKEPGIESRLDPVLDAKAAVRWVRANAKAYGIDPERIGVFGGSAGAFLANSLATTAGVEELEMSGGHEGVSCAVQAVVSCAGGCMRLDPPEGRQPDPGLLAAMAHYGRDRMEKFSPYEQVDSTDPPILILHGSRDSVVPLWQSEDLSSRYREVGLSPLFEIEKEKGHTFYLSQETVDRAIRFFEETLR